jgi:hypothetical protein
MASARSAYFLRRRKKVCNKNLPYQQNTAGLPVAVVVLDSASNELSYLLPLVPALEQALISLSRGSCVLISAEN